MSSDRLPVSEDTQAAVDAASLNAAVAGNPPVGQEEKQPAHKMKKGKDVPGGTRDYWRCQKCSFGTYFEATAREHEAHPV